MRRLSEVTVGGPGTCAFVPRGLAHAWKNPCAETGRVLFLYTPGAGGFFEELFGSITGKETNKIRRRHGWEIVGPRPSSLHLRGDRARNPDPGCSAEPPSRRR
jgi:hypothetical protein